MSETEFRVIPPLELAAILQAGQEPNGHKPDAVLVRRLKAQPWGTFTSETPAEIAWLIPGLIALGAFVFVASPPKKGKTWTMLDLALAIVLGGAFLARFQVETPRPVLLVLLEGNRTALRDRIALLGHPSPSKLYAPTGKRKALERFAIGGLACRPINLADLHRLAGLEKKGR